MQYAVPMASQAIPKPAQPCFIVTIAFIFDHGTALAQGVRF